MTGAFNKRLTTTPAKAPREPIIRFTTHPPLEYPLVHCAIVPQMTATSSASKNSVEFMYPICEPPRRLRPHSCRFPGLGWERRRIAGGLASCINFRTEYAI